MINIKYAFLGLSKKYVFTLLTVIQLVACIVFLYMGLSTSNYIKTQTDKIKGIFNNKIIYTITKKQVTTENDYSTEQLKAYYDYLKNNKSFNLAKIDYSSLYITRFNEALKFAPGKNLDKSILNHNFKGQQLSVIQSIIINKDFAEQFPLKINNGRYFSNKDFNTTKNAAMPVILGSSYSKIFKVGSEFNYLKSDENGNETTDRMEVIGFLDKDIYFAPRLNFETDESIQTFNDFIILPQDPNNTPFKETALHEITQDYIVLNDNGIKNKAKVENEIINTASKNGFNFGLRSLQQGLDKFIQDNQSNAELFNFAAIIILIFTVGSIVTIMLQTILRRFKEFGVHLLQGAAISDIAKRIFYEILIFFIVAYIISLSIIINVLSKSVLLAFSSAVFIKLTAILALLVIGISVVPVIKILSFQVDELVRGKE